MSLETVNLGTDRSIFQVISSIRRIKHILGCCFCVLKDRLTKELFNKRMGRKGSELSPKINSDNISVMQELMKFNY